MIVDGVVNLAAYARLLPGLELVAEALREPPGADAPERIELDGDRVFLMPQTVTVRDTPEAVWESHRRYADVQVVLEGVERFGWCESGAAAVREAHDEARDVAFHDPPGSIGRAGGVRFTLTPGRFVVFLPGEVHAPCLRPAAAKKGATVFKVVAKVAVG